MRKFIIVAAAAAATFATPAFAQSSAQLPVTVNILDSCSVGATGMTFVANKIGGADIDATSNVTVTCTAQTDYQVEMNWGQNASGSGPTLQRNMNGASFGEKVPYSIFQDTARSVAWSTGASAFSFVAADALPKVITAYGRIPSTAAAVRADSYNDIVTVTVTF